MNILLICINPFFFLFGGWGGWWEWSRAEGFWINLGQHVISLYFSIYSKGKDWLSYKITPLSLWIIKNINNNFLPSNMPSIISILFYICFELGSNLNSSVIIYFFSLFLYFFLKIWTSLSSSHYIFHVTTFWRN